MAWSVELLPAETARTFRHLGVFTGGFEADVAHEVTGVSRESLEALVRSSLVIREPTGRYRMLETIRDFALEGLTTDPDREAVRDRHAQSHLALAEQAFPGMAGSHAVALVQRLRTERANMRAALAHYDRSGQHVSLLRLATALTIFWYRTGADDDLEWVELALGRTPEVDDHLRGRAFYGLAICRGDQGRTEAAMTACQESYRLLRSTGDEAWLARVSNSLAGLTRDAGRAEEAAALLDEVIALRRRLASPDLPLGIPLYNRAISAMDLGDLVTARRCLAEARDLAGDDELELARTNISLADLAIAEGSVDQARALLREALPVLRRHGAESRLIELLDTLAALAVQDNVLPDAALLVGAADRAMADVASVQVPADVELRARRVGRALLDLPVADRESMSAAGRRLGLDEALDLATERLLRVAPAIGTPHHPAQDRTTP